jgi:non-heme chloroperoxidase
MPSFTTSEGLNIHYRSLGKGEPVVLVHGWMVSGDVWDPIVDALVEAGKQLIIPDQRGSGSSGKPAQGYSLEQYASDLLALVDTAGLGRFKLVGHSMGGQIAQLAAAQLGDRLESLTLVCTVPASGIPLPDEAKGLFRSCGSNPEAQTAILGMACKQLDDAGRAALLASAATVSDHCIAQAFDAWTAGGFADRLGAITCKTYVLGTDDPFLPPDFLKQAVVEPIANAEFVHLPGPGHYPQTESPAATAAQLRELLK